MWGTIRHKQSSESKFLQLALRRPYFDSKWYHVAVTASLGSCVSGFDRRGGGRAPCHSDRRGRLDFKASEDAEEARALGFQGTGDVEEARARAQGRGDAEEARARALGRAAAVAGLLNAILNHR